MSNKMLWKRLLAAGMSMAMAATLFMTNSVATYAAEEEGAGADPAPVIAGDTEDSWAPEEPATTTEEIAQEVNSLYQEVVEVKNEDGSVTRTITEVTEVQKNYYTDAETDEEVDYFTPVFGDDRDDYHRTTKEEIDASETKQHCDFVEVNEVKLVGEEHTYLEANGEKATYTNRCGEEKPIVLSDNFTAADLERAEQNPVQVVEDSNGVVRELKDKEKKSIFYGKFVDGVFVELKEGDEGATPFLRSDDKYVPTDVVYTTMIKDEDGNSEIAFIDKKTFEEACKALNGEESIYSVETVYTHKKQGHKDKDSTITSTELKEKEANEQAEVWGNYEPEKNNPIDYYINVTDITVAPESTTLKMFGNEKTVYYNKFIVTGEANEDGTIPVDYFFYDGNTRYTVSGVIDKLPEGAGVGYVDDCWIKAKVKKDTEVHVVTINDNKNFTLSYVTVKDPETQEIIFEGTPEALANLKAHNVTEVEDKIKVRDSYKTYYLDKADYTLIKEHTENLYVSENFYYTVQDKTETNNVEFSMGGRDYNLTVDFWQNSRIGLKGIRVLPNEDGTEADIIVEYDYSKYSDFDESNPPTSYTQHVTVDDFSSLGEAKMSIDFLPVFFSTIMPHWFRPVQEPILVLSANDAVRVQASTIAAPGLRTLSNVDNAILFGILEEAGYYNVGPTGYVASDISGYPFAQNRVELIQRTPKWEKGAEPQPQPRRRNEEPSGEPTTIDVTPVALAAAPGQVLGAQREETAADGAAVLGASRARGTADETTAPFVRVIIMAAVAGAALFLTRKREEEN